MSVGGIERQDCGADLPDSRFAYFYTCDGCGAYGPPAGSYLAAAEAWNARRTASIESEVHRG